MTQQYLVGELSVLLAQLQAAMTDEASVANAAELRQRAETGPRSGLTHVVVRALELADWECRDSLIRGNALAFIRQDAASTELREFGICAGLIGRVARR